MLGTSRYEREDFDAYFTTDKMCLDTLLDALIEAGAIATVAPGLSANGARILEPAAGRGHLVKGLRDAGFTVDARDLVLHPDPLINDIVQGDILSITSLAGYAAVITNLPYLTQDELLEHLPPIAARDGVMVATLTRAPWHIAKRRRNLVHQHPHFEGVMTLPRRPWWSEDRRAAPRHEFCWNLWGAAPRAASRPSIFYPSGRVK